MTVCTAHATSAISLLYAGALLVLFLTPGPVWLAMLARALSGGFHAAWPLALGVVVGDVLWPLLAVLGVTWILSVFAGFMLALRWICRVMFVVMGVVLIRTPTAIAADSRLTRPGTWAGFMAGLAAILGNPKAILFYMGVLPGFFDLTRITRLTSPRSCSAFAFVPLGGQPQPRVFRGPDAPAVARPCAGAPMSCGRLLLWSASDRFIADSSPAVAACRASSLTTKSWGHRVTSPPKTL